MSLTTGTRIGSYEVVSAIGAGGMGEVYRARDTKLNRDVALKILPAEFAADPDRLARFKREAQVLASLNHPNIAAIYGLEGQDGREGPLALVLELVEGPTLADRIAQGPLPIDDALPIAKQIAEALEAAHEQGIVHRDLKPANIKVRPNGTVKVLDFGLAKAFEPASSGIAVTNSPTITTPAMTMVGMILGTAAYMSPEQARGRLVDRRTDVWAFGCVLFEMLSGKRAFDGEDIAETIGAIIHKEPDWVALSSAAPPVVVNAIKRCLTKDPRQRIRDVGDVQLALDGVFETELVRDSAASVRPRRSSRAAVWAGAAAVAAAGLAFALATWAPWRSRATPSPVRLEVGIGADASVGADSGSSSIALSPDGTTLAFVTGVPRLLYVRRLDQLRATPLAGTEGARGPFFSPDGAWIAFFAPPKLKKVAVTGGAVVTLADVSADRGGSWIDPNVIVFAGVSQAALFRVSSEGGTAEPLTMLSGRELTHRWPQILPGGKAVLYTRHTNLVGFNEAEIVAQPLPNGAPKVVQRGAYAGTYLPSGHIVYVRDRTLFAAPFDLNRLELTGPPVPAIEGLASRASGGSAQFAVASNGTLVYLPESTSTNELPLQWMDHNGKTTPLRTAAADWSNVVVSPDGRRLAMDISDGRQTDIYVYDVARDTPTRLTFGPGNSQKPVWSPDGQRIVFAKRSDKSELNLFWQRADGTGEAQQLTDTTFNQSAWSFHPSGKFLALHQFTPPNGDDILIVPIEGDQASGWKPGKPLPFLHAAYSERAPMFSPDGHWVAYQSTESGRDEVYVTRFPGPSGKWQISNGGGITPTWSQARKELFFASGTQIMVAPYTVEGDSFHAEKPRLWSAGHFLPRQRVGPTRSFDLHPDGNRFALSIPQDAGVEVKQDKVVFVFNFFDELRRIAPVRR
jgi:serine/threonine-protein kinase